MNLEYPLRVELTGSATQLDEAVLKPEHASERSESRVRFSTDVHWSAAGDQWISARVQFAMCTPDTCVPDERTVAVAVQVE